jgi:hypothetical protein
LKKVLQKSKMVRLQTITKDRVKTRDPASAGYIETHRDRYSGLFGGEWMGRRYPSKEAWRAHIEAVKKKWPDQKWHLGDSVPEPPYPLESIAMAYSMPTRRTRKRRKP